jgi:sigma-B regulation protein RsbU (phosphoserine phosphatase)
MGAPESIPASLPTASLEVWDPSGGRTRVPLAALPFLIGRQAGNQLVLRDSRISRTHARIVGEGGAHVIEDLSSLNGVFVNDERVRRRRLNPSDRIDFGLADSYRLVYTSGEHGLGQLAGKIAAPAREGGELARLRALVELARALETSLSATDVLAALVDAALAITGAERGFLLLREGDGLEFRVARDSRGAPLTSADLRVPTSVIHQALTRRRELLSMSFDPLSGDAALPTRTVVELELRSAVCVPLVKIRSGTGAGTAAPPPAEETIGVLYMDSRAGAADLAGGNRELLQTLALEASTILENARLLEGERARQRMEEELKIARQIQESLLPRELPTSGWLCAAGRSIPSRQVGGDYFDLRQISPSAWALINADVSGKGVSSALLASLLQGVFLAAPFISISAEEAMARLNSFLLERTGGEKYATLFFGTLDRDGLLRYVNAGHGDALLVRAAGRLDPLPPTGFPVGMLEEAAYTAEEVRLAGGDKLLLHTDGLSEAEDVEGNPFGEAGIRQVALANTRSDSQAMFESLAAALAAHTGGAAQKDDITFMIVEYRSERG